MKARERNQTENEMSKKKRDKETERLNWKARA
jgi:hypothetical protein